jgi:glycosyltransferase involved in cell wall biosynthesis
MQRVLGEREGETARIGIVFPGDPRAPKTWSGTPAGVARGFEEAGAAVVPVHADLPRALEFVARNAVALRMLPRTRTGTLEGSLRLARAVARISPELGRCYGWAARARLRRTGPVDGLVQIGTGYTLGGDAPIVTFEDITIPQALALGYPDWLALSRRALGTALDRQRRAYDRAAACCLTTNWAADSVISDYGVPSEKVHVVGLGRNYTPPAGPRRWESPRFLFVGKDWQGKNGEAVLRAFARLRTEIPEAHLDIVGHHPRLDAPGVVGHGFLRMGVAEDRATLERLFQTATCFVLPSRYEASAIVYLEAGAAGLPSIVTSVGGSREFVGEAGRVVDPRDDEALLAAMLELAHPDTAARLGALARARSDLFTWRAVSERLLRALALDGVATDRLAAFLER